ncbi:uncharacterized protein LOC117282583 isoform X2 [Cryptotermes secundus]|uniref:uncharacterized protein LOC117282583 isoform X2 n=1 Tax=Cryptotermes secundus TaxID=105785 RepID=UPI001454C455|nr:uncharacterized protein LOC117282583 isoform X2 [Cryptotermes secundus]
MNCTNSENVLVGPYGEMYPASRHANQAMNIKVEQVSESQEEADPLQITIQEIKDYTNSENVLVGPYGETYPTSHDADQAMKVKAKADSDAEEEGDPVAITFPEVKAEPEVSCKCTVRQMTQKCRSTGCLYDFHLCLFS